MHMHLLAGQKRFKNEYEDGNQRVYQITFWGPESASCILYQENHSRPDSL